MDTIVKQTFGIFIKKILLSDRIFENPLFYRSVGIIAFEVFTLKLPFRGKDELDLKRAIVYDQLPDFDIRNDLRNLVKM